MWVMTSPKWVASESTYDPLRGRKPIRIQFPVFNPGLREVAPSGLEIRQVKP